MHFFKKLSIFYCEDSLELLSKHLIVCTEVNVFSHWNYKCENEILAKNLMNMECLSLYGDSVNILLLIQQLSNLKKIKLIDFRSVENLKLEVLNTEREKLTGARKVTIYVPAWVYLATKCATKNGITTFSLIEIKRIFMRKKGT